MNSAESRSEGKADEYVSVGYFDPLVGKRIMRHLARGRIRFAARDASGVGIAGAEVPYSHPLPVPYPILHRLSRIELLIHAADMPAAQPIIDET